MTESVSVPNGFIVPTCAYLYWWRYLRSCLTIYLLLLLQAFYPSSIAQEKWKEVALDDKNVRLADEDIAKLVCQQRCEDQAAVY